MISRREFIKLGMAAAVARQGAPHSTYPASPASPASPAAEEIFTECAKESGIDFVHFNGMSGSHYYPEVMGSGVALFDYDNDGDLDIFLVQGALLGPNKEQ